ncbi:uncharacterized protein BDCG_02515 [Blastomyces dermatitidis ER-3]|uniref:Uncharacterized protein n=1 Tax=Ajellomyces dermatitidis (strain ER-3 / ATCC MYA-2586) TaxID=559297 RepID=A0ABP2EU25_AJEDR|nr:uncharacterized protein BDCG_02515 [Blastomyces dermatitidis ER-3]EEQ87395.2 hypothetical protein BDCG_02515 [Blastomyces dermatitidis ER-3]
MTATRLIGIPLMRLVKMSYQEPSGSIRGAHTKEPPSSKHETIDCELATSSL